MPTYGQFCPIARSLEILGERWTLLVVRELMCGSSGFNQIRRGLPGIPRDTLTKRLRTLERADVVARTGSGRATVYRLTEAGAALEPLVAELAGWAYQWDRRGLLPEHLDPNALLWNIHQRVDVAAVAVSLAAPAETERLVVKFELTERPSGDREMWLILAGTGAEVCLTDGGYDTDLVVVATTETIAHWWLGQLPWTTATKSGTITVRGPSHLIRDFPGWFLGYALQPALPLPSQPATHRGRHTSN